METHTHKQIAGMLYELQKLAAEEHEIEEYKKATLDYIKEWTDNKKQPLQERQTHLRAALTEWLETEGKQKAAFPHATISRIKPTSRLKVTDQEALLKWAETEAPEMIETTRRCDQTNLKPVEDGLITPDGEKIAAPPGTEIYTTGNALRVAFKAQ